MMSNSGKQGGLSSQVVPIAKQPSVQHWKAKEDKETNPFVSKSLWRDGPLSEETLKLMIRLAKIMQDRSSVRGFEQIIDPRGRKAYGTKKDIAPRLD